MIDSDVVKNQLEAEKLLREFEEVLEKGQTKQISPEISMAVTVNLMVRIAKLRGTKEVIALIMLAAEDNEVAGTLSALFSAGYAIGYARGQWQ
jgi:hypothetical protein